MKHRRKGKFEVRGLRLEVRSIVVAGLVSLLTACSGAVASPSTSNIEPPTTSAVVTTASTSTIVLETTTTAAPTTTTAPPEPGTVRPDWLGTRLLELRPDGLGVPQPTPPELVNRRFPSPDLLPPPSGEAFEWTSEAVPVDVANRSSWREECPVPLAGLTYLTMGFHGFDGLAHTGEMIVAAEFADGVIEVFRRLWEVSFPIEEMRVQDQEEMDAHPTGDGNVTGSFECRPAVGQSGGWSMHAYGLAVDINPFHNPYTRGEVVAPELASAYIDRTNVRAGMILEGDTAVDAFDEMGWGWGGR